MEDQYQTYRAMSLNSKGSNDMNGNSRMMHSLLGGNILTKSNNNYSAYDDKSSVLSAKNNNANKKNG